MTFFFFSLATKQRKRKSWSCQLQKKKEKKVQKSPFPSRSFHFLCNKRPIDKKIIFFPFISQQPNKALERERERERERYGQGKWKSRRTLCFSNATPGLRAKSPSRQSWIRSCTRIKWRSCWLKGRNIWRTWAWLICVWGIEKIAPFS